MLDVSSQVLQILNSLYGEGDYSIEKAEGGVFESVYFFNHNGEKVIKLFPIKHFSVEDFYSELFFLLESKKVGVNVPEILHYELLSSEAGYLIMEYIEGHKDPHQNIPLYTSGIVEALKKIETVELKGFGRFIGKDIDDKRFQYQSLHEWIVGEQQRWKGIFSQHSVVDKLELVDLVTNTFLKLIPNTTSSFLTHDDLGIRNTINDGKKIYLFDAGPHRAMPKLWDVAAFDYRYFKSNDLYEQELLKSFYDNYLLSNKLSDDDLKKIIVYRAMIAIEKHWGRMGNQTYKNEGFVLKTEQCINALKILKD